MLRRSLRRITEVESVIVGRLEEGADADLDGKQQRSNDHDTEYEQGEHALRVTPPSLVANCTTGVAEV
ncbi:MAG TPA: hypothetical protein VH701_09180 [Vicinamibacterales bacterium]|jgi:hypothetical protein